MPESRRYLINAITALLLTVAASAEALATGGGGGLVEVPFAKLGDRNLMPLGQAALALKANEWKHAESPNFVYHYFHSFIAAPVAAEAEFHYRVIARELEKDTTQWERKCHIFIFETPAEWAEFQSKASLDPWTGGIHAGGELFIQRNPELRWKGDTLAHEIAHLVVHRFFGNGVPLWLNEGYAEYAASRSHAAFHRARGFRARPNSRAVDPSQFLPLQELTSAATYPRDTKRVSTFYHESERLVRFLSATDKRGFGHFFAALAQGNRLESALSKGFSNRFTSLESLERDFKAYAVKDYSPAESE